MFTSEKNKKYYLKHLQDAENVYNRLEKSGWIASFRRGWSLPENGCSDSKSYQRWHAEFIVRQTNLLFEKPAYIKMQEKLKRKKMQWAKGKIDFSEIENYEDHVSLKVPLYKFDRDIQMIMTQLRIPQCYEPFVRSSFVYKGIPKSFPLWKSDLNLEFSFDPETKRKRLFVEVFSDTKVADFKDKVFQVKLKDYQKRLYDYGTIKQVGMKDVAKWNEIYKMHYFEKKSYKAISRIIGIEDVATGLKRYKKSLGLSKDKKSVKKTSQ